MAEYLFYHVRVVDDRYDAHRLAALETAKRIGMPDFADDIPPLFGGEFLQDAFGISKAEKPWMVRLLFAKEVATYIRERVWHSSQQLRERRDGSLELRLETSGRKELTRWILSWMPHVKVLAPRQLQDRVRERMRQGLAACG